MARYANADYICKKYCGFSNLACDTVCMVFREIVHFLLPVLDFQKIGDLIREFLSKLSEDEECSELRDAFNYALLQLGRYYRVLLAQARRDADDGGTLPWDKGIGPVTPRSVVPHKFTCKWVEGDCVDSVAKTVPNPLQSSQDALRLPVILRSIKQGDNGFISMLLERGLCCSFLAYFILKLVALWFI